MHYEKFADGTIKCIEDEIPFELPEGWEWERLSNISRFSGGKTPSTSNPKLWNGDVLWITSKDMKNKYISSSQLHLSDEGAKQMQLHSPNTLLIVTRSGILRHTLPIAILKKQATINQDLKAIILYYLELAEYIYICLKGMESRLLLKYTKSGTTVENINFDEFQKVLIPIAPLQEVNKIISKVDAIIKLIDKIEENKLYLTASVLHIKNKILDLAIRGMLVPQDPNDEPASALLERIRAEKEELMKQGKIKRDKNESVIFRGEDNSYYLKTENQIEDIIDWNIIDIPNTWTVCCLGEICDYGNCVNVDAKDIPEHAWILELEDIEKDTGKVLKKIRKKDRNSTSTKHFFKKKQVLYSKLRPYLNKVVLADDDGYCTSEILPLDFNEYILPEYARLYMMSPPFFRYANRCSYGIKMPRLGTTDGKMAVFVIPPTKEQKRIADRVSQLFSMLDSIEKSLL